MNPTDVVTSNQTRQPATGGWRYRTAPVSRIRLNRWIAAAIAASAHALALFAFNFERKPEPAAPAAVEIIEVRLAMPEPEPEVEPVEELVDSNEIAGGGVPVPSLADIPVAVTIDSFVQVANFRPEVNLDLGGAQLVNIPMQFGNGSGSGGNGLGNVFNLGDLDRQPEALVQVSPQFPISMKREASEGQVMVGFIVDSTGTVTNVHVISSSHTGFDHAAILGVSKWKFRPGMKAGKRVATRMRVPLRFMLTSADV